MGAARPNEKRLNRLNVAGDESPRPLNDAQVTTAHWVVEMKSQPIVSWTCLGGALWLQANAFEATVWQRSSTKKKYPSIHF